MEQTLFSAEEFKKMGSKKRKKNQGESKLQVSICEYIKTKYPHVIFTCDLASGMKLPIHVAARNKKMRSSRGIPDLFIAHPSNGYSGLWIELKVESARLKNGGIAKSDHHDEQMSIIDKLNSLGFKAVFACGRYEAEAFIDGYLS